MAAGNAVQNLNAPGLRVREISMETPWTWLSKAWIELWEYPRVTLAYGAGFAVLSFALVALLVWFRTLPLVLPLTGGFLLLGPMLAVGLYETARRAGRGERIGLREALFVKTASPSQLAFVGVVLLLAYFAWVRLAWLIFAFWNGINAAMPPFDVFFANLFFTREGIGLLITGSLAGGAIAFFIFAMSAVSVPLLMSREIDAVTAVLLSLEAVKRNFWPMMLWAWLILLLVAFGIATAFIGLIVTFPLVGLATWHAKESLIAED
ncbi:MAG: DUF2189 domain-containing protein [Rhodothalassiaceae bacterium]